MLPKHTLLANALARLNKLVLDDEAPIESARRAADSLIKYCLNPDADKAEAAARRADDILNGKPVLRRDCPITECRGDGIPISHRLPVCPDDDGVTDPNDLVERSFCDYGVPADFDDEDVAHYRKRFVSRILAQRAHEQANSPGATGGLSASANGCHGQRGPPAADRVGGDRFVAVLHEQIDSASFPPETPARQQTFVGNPCADTGNPERTRPDPRTAIGNTGDCVSASRSRV